MDFYLPLNVDSKEGNLVKPVVVTETEDFVMAERRRAQLYLYQVETLLKKMDSPLLMYLMLWIFADLVNT